MDLLIGVRIPAGQPSVSEADRGDEKQGGEREKRVESKSLLGSIIKLSKESSGKEYADIEAKEAGGKFIDFFELLIQIDKRNKQNKVIKAD